MRTPVSAAPASGELEGSGVDVDTDDVVAVAGSEKSLDAGARPDVERRADGASCRQARESEEPGATGATKSFRQPAGERKVMDDEEVLVRLHAHVRPNKSCVTLREPGLD